ncbi:MAG: hypothetical protein M0008_09405 [Actinomycetota bacterium]|nr:hypothetical protein [Actinomycetota bacterium]
MDARRKARSSRRIRSVIATALGSASLTLGAFVGVLASPPAANAVAGSLAFGSAVNVGSVGSLGEPGIVIAPPGTPNAGDLYIDAPTGVPFASDVFLSTNKGATWALTSPGLRALAPGGGDASLAVGPVSGNLYLVDLWLGSSTASESTNNAASWVTNPLGGLVVQDRQWITAAGGGSTFVAYHQIPSGILVTKMISVGGALVPTTTTVAASVTDQTGCECPPGNLISQGASNVGVIYSTSSGGVNFASSTNGGLTFSNATVAPASSASTLNSFPVVADAGAGNLVAVWLDDSASGTNVELATSSDFGASWSAPHTLLSKGAGTYVYPWIAARGSQAVVSYYNATTAGSNLANSTPDGAPSSTLWYENALGLTISGFGAGRSAFTATTPVVADTVPVKNGPVCTQGAGCSANRQLLDFQSVALGQPSSSGTIPVDLAYTDVCGFSTSECPNLPSSDTQLRFVAGTLTS